VSNFAVSVSKIICAAALLSAAVALSACGIGGGAVPTQTAIISPRVGGLHTVVHPNASSCTYPNAQRQRLYDSNVPLDEIESYSPPNPNSTQVTSLSDPGEDIEFDHQKNMWVSEMFSRDISEYAPPYNGAPIFVSSKPYGVPWGLAFDGADNLYVADFGYNRVDILAPPYTVIAAIISIPEPQSIALDSNCDLWVTSGRTRVVEFKPPFTLATSNTALTTIPIPGASALALDSHANLFVGTFMQPQDMVLEYAPPYTGAPIATVTSGIGHVSGVDLDVNGNLFVSNYDLNTITEYAAPYTGPPVLTLTDNVFTPSGVSFGPK